MSKRILIVGAGGNQVEMIKKARQLGFYTIAMDGSSHAPGFAVADAFESANITDPDEVTRVARAHQADGCYPAAEWSVEATAHATTRLGLPGCRPEIAERVRNKRVMREALAAKGVPCPAFKGVRTLEEAYAAVEAIGLPVIVKPADGNASRGVKRVDRIEELPAAFQLALGKARVGEALIESFMEGEEFGVDGLVYEGRYILGGITGKHRSQPPDRFDLGLCMPPLISDADAQALEDTVSAALEAIEFRNGTTHIEVILHKDGPRIVEMAGRPGGARIPTDLVPMAYGMDYIADSLRIALGEAPIEARRFLRGSAIYWIPAPPGRVLSISGVEAARALPGVKEVVVAAKPGDVLEPIIDCVTRDKVGYVLTEGDTPQAAIDAATRACGALCIETEPSGAPE